MSQEQNTQNITQTIQERLPKNWKEKFEDYLMIDGNEWLNTEYWEYCMRFKTGHTWEEDYAWANGPFLKGYVEKLIELVELSEDFTSVEYSEAYPEGPMEGLYDIALDHFGEVVENMDEIPRD